MKPQKFCLCFIYFQIIHEPFDMKLGAYIELPLLFDKVLMLSVGDSKKVEWARYYNRHSSKTM